MHASKLQPARLRIFQKPVPGILLAALLVCTGTRHASAAELNMDELQLALLFIAHDLATVRYLCDRVMVLYGGRICEIDKL